MLSAAVSTLALALALGPQLHVSLQAAIETSQPAVDVSEAEADISTLEPELAVNDAAVDAEPINVRLEPDPIIEAPEESVESTDPDPINAEASASAEIDTETPSEVATGEVAAEDWPGVLSAASAALSDARTAKGKFTQTNADGSLTTGTFALNRPGRMRFDYDDPTPVLIVSDGTTVAVEDSELETVDRVPIGATPLGLILSTDLNVDEDVEVLSIMQNADRIGIRVSDANGEMDGTLMMVFDKNTYDLLGWLATDGNLQTTVVDLLDVETNVSVDPRLFRLDEAEDEEDER